MSNDVLITIVFLSFVIGFGGSVYILAQWDKPKKAKQK